MEFFVFLFFIYFGTSRVHAGKTFENVYYILTLLQSITPSLDMEEM